MFMRAWSTKKSGHNFLIFCPSKHFFNQYFPVVVSILSTNFLRSKRIKESQLISDYLIVFFAFLALNLTFTMAIACPVKLDLVWNLLQPENIRKFSCILYFYSRALEVGSYCSIKFSAWLQQRFIRNRILCTLVIPTATCVHKYLQNERLMKLHFFFR